MEPAHEIWAKKTKKRLNITTQKAKKGEKKPKQHYSITITWTRPGGDSSQQHEGVNGVMSGLVDRKHGEESG